MPRDAGTEVHGVVGGLRVARPKDGSRHRAVESSRPGAAKLPIWREVEAARSAPRHLHHLLNISEDLQVPAPVWCLAIAVDVTRDHPPRPIRVLGLMAPLDVPNRSGVITAADHVDIQDRTSAGSTRGLQLQ